jgi:hypothetical protein
MQESIKIIIEALTKLAGALGQQVSFLWPQYLRWIVADGVAGILCGMTILSSIYFYWVKIFPKLKEDDARIAGAVTGNVVGVIAGIIALILIFGDLAQVISPAGYAVSKILCGKYP